MEVTRQFDRVLGTIRTRRHLELKERAAQLDGCMVHLEALWQIEDDDRRYPGEWAMSPVDTAGIALFHSAGIGWIASGDVEFTPTPTREA